MIKFSFLLILAFLFRLPLASAQTLSVGDIAIIGANAVNPDEFAFVALVDIPQGTVIGFVDHGWLASGAFRTNEDELFYTATGTISKGTVVIIDTVDAAPRSSLRHLTNTVQIAISWSQAIRSGSSFKRNFHTGTNICHCFWYHSSVGRAKD